MIQALALAGSGAMQLASALSFPSVSRSICNWRSAGGNSFHSETLGGSMPSALASRALFPKWAMQSKVFTPPSVGVPNGRRNRRHLTFRKSGKQNQCMSSIGSRIKALRLAHGLSGAELARRIGIKAPSLWEIEHGETKSVRGNTLAALCVELHTTQAFILDGEPAGVSLQLATMEAELLYTIRALEPHQRLSLMEYARFLRGQQPVKAQDGEAAVKPANVSQIGKRKKR